MPLSEQLLEVARARLNETSSRSEGNLRRAASDLYYAVFHAICESQVEPLLEPLSANPDDKALVDFYRDLYRQLDHGTAEKKCKEIAQSKDYPDAVRRFAKHFVQLKNKRESADYDPLEQFSISAIKNDLSTTETRLKEFRNVDLVDRAQFARDLSFRKRGASKRSNAIRKEDQ